MPGWVQDKGERWDVLRGMWDRVQELQRHGMHVMRVELPFSKWYMFINHEQLLPDRPLLIMRLRQQHSTLLAVHIPILHKPKQHMRERVIYPMQVLELSQPVPVPERVQCDGVRINNCPILEQEHQPSDMFAEVVD